MEKDNQGHEKNREKVISLLSDLFFALVRIPPLDPIFKKLTRALYDVGRIQARTAHAVY